MARIELRDTTILIKDGLAGTAAVSDLVIADQDTTLEIDTVALNTDDPDLVPIGARFTFDTGQPGTVFTVTGRIPPTASPTTDISFSPPLDATNTLPIDTEVINFTNQQIEVKLGEGNLTYTENKEYEYELDRGNLDTVRELDEQPLDVSLDFIYEFVTTGTGEAITPVDALKRKNAASEWVSASDDLCEPYAVDICVVHVPDCGATEGETTEFPEFRHDTLEFDLSEATISVTGRCNVSEPNVTRS